MSWGWRKLLQLRDIVRPFFWVKLGNGASTSLWYDNWCSSSPLIRFLSHRDITTEGFYIQTRIAVPSIDESRADLRQWRDSYGKLSVFSVSKAWEELRSRVRPLAAMDNIPPVMHDILLYLHPMANKTRSIFGKLILAASSYYLWLERNNRIFKNARKTPEEFRDLIIVTVRLKLLVFRFKDTAMMVGPCSAAGQLVGVVVVDGGMGCLR
ncbi:hypothetical protein Tco_1209342 [Tanacetum coccineum]